jgi:hypothetical protein
MFLSKEDAQDNLPQLQKKMQTLRSELTTLLEHIGMDREQFDQFISDPRHFTGSDWYKINQELDKFKQSLDLINFSSSQEQLEKKREEMRAQSQWMRQRHTP